MHLTSRKAIFFEPIIESIKTINQLINYIYETEGILTPLFNSNLLKQNIHIDKDIIDIAPEDLPRFINLNIMKELV